MDYVTFLASLTVAEFKTFRKALRVLRAAGLDCDQAVEILVRAATNCRHDKMKSRAYAS